MKIQGVRLQGTKLVPSGAAVVDSDTYFNLVSLLLPGNGTNGQTNNTFLDSSTNAFTITRNGNTTQGTFSPFSQTGWSNYFGGNGNLLSLADNAAWDFAANDFTIECWAYTNAFASQYNVFVCQWDGNTQAWIFRITSGLIGLYANIGGTQNYTATVTNTLNSWDHYAVTRSGGTVTFWKNGISVGTAAISGTIGNATANVTIAVLGDGNSTTVHNGYISNLRIVKGTAVYTSAFTPSTTPLTAISGTSLLTCQSNRFIDNSTNAFAITVSGNPSVQAFAPFDPTIAYSAGTVGGSAYFDGSGDYLTVPDNAALEMGSSNFTIECWFYPLSLPADALLADFGSQGVQGSLIPFYCSSSSVVYYISSGGSSWNIASAVGFGGTLRVGQWHHLALVRNGNTYTPYFNGVAGTTTTNSATINDAAVNKFIGSATTGTSAINGYVSNFRVVKGTAVYTSAFTPPTAPVTAIANTSLLLNFTNAGIYDATSKNILETIGAQISTTQSKFGSSSIYTGTSGSNYLRIPISPFFLFETENFTVEGWFYPTGSGNERTFYIHGINTTGGLTLFCGTGGARFRSDGTTDLSYSTTISGFTHIAFVRNGNTRLIFINGTQVASDTLSFNVSDNVITDIGASDQNASDAFRYYGYIQDLRITKGVARYTSNFTPPTAAFPTQ